MPPKGKTGKKDDELESVEGLPKSFPFLIQLHYNVANPPTKDLLIQHLETQPDPKCKLMTRTDIIDCGKRKGILTEEDDPENPNPTHLAKSAAARLYELQVESMKEKATRYAQIKEKAIADYWEAKKPKEEEAKGKKPPPKAQPKKDEPPPPDLVVEYPPDEIDIFVIVKDYPRNEPEAIEFAKERYSLNAIVSIKEGVYVPPPKVEGDESEKKDESQEKIEEKKEEKKEAKKEAKKEVKKGGKAEDKKEDVPHELTEEEKKQLEEAAEKLKEDAKNSEEFLYMLKKLGKESIRDSPLRDIVKIEIEACVNPEDKESSAIIFRETLVKTLAEFGLSYINYYKYLNGVGITVMDKPTPEVEAKILEERRLEEERLKEEEQKRKEEEERKLEEAKKEAKKEGKKEAKKEVKKQDPDKKVYDTDAVYPFQRPKHPLSLDDIPEDCPLYWYRKNIENITPEKRTVGCILISMLQQIEGSQEEEVKPKFTEVENLMHLFDKTKYSMLNKKSESAPQAKEEVEEEIEEGQKNNIYNEYDFVKSQYHGEKLLASDVSLPYSELSILNNLLYPGKNRQMSEPIIAKPEYLRKSMKCEMHPFSSLPIYEFDRALILTAFEQMFAQVNPRAAWDFGDREYEEILPKEALSEVFSNALMFSPETLVNYNVLEDCLLVGLYYRTPPERILIKEWQAKFKHMPDFPNYLGFFNKEFNEMPKTLLDIDDNKAGLIEEREKFLYPSDDSVIRVCEHKTGGDNLASIQVLKDNYIFGLREDNGKPEFWLQFENGTKLKVEMKPQKDKEGELLNLSLATLTLAEGLIVKFAGTGDIIQMRTENIQDPSKASELHRVITGKGTVIKYCIDGSINVMMTNGSTSEFKDGAWIGINSKGKRRRRAEQETELTPINCASKTDPESLARITLREDNLILIKHEDGRLYTRHKDGTLMMTSKDESSIIVQKQKYAPVMIKLDKDQARSQTQTNIIIENEVKGSDNIMKRSNDGRVVQTYLPDNTFVETFKDVMQLPTGEYIMNYVHILRRPDGGVIKIDSKGEIVIITSNERVMLKEEDKELGHEIGRAHV